MDQSTAVALAVGVVGAVTFAANGVDGAHDARQRATGAGCGGQ